MALTQDDKQEIMAMLATLMGTNASGALEPISKPELEPSSVGPLAGALEGATTFNEYAWLINDFSVSVGNRFTRADVYRLLVEMIYKMEAMEEPWIAHSENSWRFCREALMTRASEIEGDAFTTEWPLMKSHVQAMAELDYGVAEHYMNISDVVMRKITGMYISQRGDKDIGAQSEPLTNAECVRLCYVFLDVLIDTKIVPDDADSNFMKVRKELYAQYKAMGEGTFGPWSHPGGSTPWSWAGGK